MVFICPALQSHVVHRHFWVRFTHFVSPLKDMMDNFSSHNFGLIQLFDDILESHFWLRLIFMEISDTLHI